MLEFFQVTSLKMTRHQKRKIDETHVEVGTGHKLLLILWREVLFTVLLVVMKSYLYQNLQNQLERSSEPKGKIGFWMQILLI